MKPLTELEIAAWRQAERKRLLELRLSLSEDIQRRAKPIAEKIEQLFELPSGLVISFYWPLPGEIDFLFWMKSLSAREVQIALPVVISRAKPMEFRAWNPESVMVAGKGNIPVPRDGLVVTPDVVIAPLVGFDAACYRLGYGTGCFDRTLASLSPRPTVIGVGHGLCEIDDIHPLPHDVPMDLIVTGDAKVRYRKGYKPT